jgi:hypothetical protein
MARGGVCRASYPSPQDLPRNESKDPSEVPYGPYACSNLSQKEPRPSCRAAVPIIIGGIGIIRCAIKSRTEVPRAQHLNLEGNSRLSLAFNPGILHR